MLLVCLITLVAGSLIHGRLSEDEISILWGKSVFLNLFHIENRDETQAFSGRKCQKREDLEV